MEDLCKIRDVYRAIAEFETQFMQQYNLSLNEGMLLCTLLNTPRLTSGEIAEALGLTCSNTSKLIRSVEEKKLIARIIGKVDKRQMHFSLTAEGKEQITAIKSTTHEMPELLQQWWVCWKIEDGDIFISIFKIIKIFRGFCLRLL